MSTTSQAWRFFGSDARERAGWGLSWRPRLNGLIRQLPFTNRCTLTSDAIRIAVFYTEIYNRPLVSFTPPASSRPHQNSKLC